MINWAAIQDATCIGIFLAGLYIGFAYVREKIRSKKYGFRTMTKYDIVD